MSRKPYKDKHRSSSFSNSIVWPKEDERTSPIIEFDFSSMISELNQALKEKDASLLEAEEITADLEVRLNVSEDGCRKLLEQIESLQIQLEEKKSALEHSMQENDILRENLYELESKADALENATIEKDTNLQQLERNLHLWQEESEALQRSRARTCNLIEQAKQDNEVLSVEVENTKRNSIFVHQEAVKLSEELRKAKRKIESLTKSNEMLELQVKEIENLKDSCEEENQYMRSELTTLKSMVENKTFELIDAERELETLREQVGGDWQEDLAIGILEQTEDFDAVRARKTSISVLEAGNMETSRRNSIDDDALRGEGERLEDQNLLVMLHQSGHYVERQLAVDEKRSESENDEGLELSLHESADENAQDEVDTRRNLTMKRDASSANKDMLIVFLYLTAAAVKLQYSDVDIKTAELIHLGQDLPFWEVYPFFVRVIESLKAKNAGLEQTTERKSTSKISGLFSWRKRKERKKKERFNTYV